MKKNKSLIIMIILAIIYIGFSIVVANGLLDKFDFVFYEKITSHMSKNLILIVKGITSIGGPLMVIGICAFLVFYPKTRWNFGVMVAFGSLITFTTGFIFKSIFARERPDILQLVHEGSYSYPSGHAAVSVVMYLLLAFYIYKTIKSKKMRNFLIIICTIVPIIIGLSRVYLGIHYMTDIIGGWILGILMTLVSYKLYKILNIEGGKVEKTFVNCWHNISAWFRGLFRS